MYPVPHTEEHYQFLQSISIGTKLVVPLKRAQLRRKVAFARSDLASAIRSELPFLLDNFITTSNTASDQVINNMRCIPLGPTAPASQFFVVRALAPVQRISVFVAWRLPPS